MYNTLIIVSRFISKATTVTTVYKGVSSPRSNAKVIEILKKDLPLLCND